MAIVSLDDLEQQSSPVSSSSVVSLDDLEKQATPATSSTVVPLDQLEQHPSYGEIRNPVAEPFNLFPMSSALFNKTHTVTPLSAIPAAMDVIRDIPKLGKTFLQQGMNPDEMSFGGRFRKNLADDRSLGAEVADNYVPAIAEGAVANNEVPADASNRIALLHALISNGIDIGGFLGLGGPKGVDTVVRGGANIFNQVRGASKIKSLPIPDESPFYQQWLQQNAQHPDGPNPFFDVPLHPAEDARAAIAQVPEEIPGAQGQLGFRGFLPQNDRPAVALDAQGVPIEVPPREQGQQNFDFTKGPAEVSAQPSVIPQDNVIQLSAQAQKEIDQLTKMPNLARPKPYQGLSRDQIQEMFINRIAGKPVKQLPPAFDPEQLPGQMKKLDRTYNEADPYEMMAGEQDRIRREQLIRDRQSVDELVKKEEATQDPSLLEDIKTILTNIKPRSGLSMSMGIPAWETTPEGQVALARTKTKLLQYMRTTGLSAVEAAKVVAPHMTPEQISSLMQATKIENLNLRQYPEEQKQQLQGLFAGEENKLKTVPMTHAQIVEKAKGLSSFPVTDAMARGGEGQLAAEKVRKKMNNIAKLKVISEAPELSSTEMMQKINQVDTMGVKKISTESARALNAGQIPLEAQQESITALRKIVDRLRADPQLSSAQSKAFISQLKSQDPELARATTPAEIYKFVYRNFITSGPITLGVNMGSGLGQIGARVPMRAIEVTLAKLRSLATGTPTSATYKEIGAMLKGMQEGLVGKQLPEHLKAQTFTDKYQANPLDILAASTNSKKGAKVLDVASKTVGAPEVIMRKSDEYVKNTIGMMEKYAAEARGEDVLTDQHAIERITSAQSRLSFQDDMSEIGKWVARLRHSNYDNPTAVNQALDIVTYSIQPFIHTVDRIIAAGWNQSIFGSAGTGVKVVAGAFNKGKYAGALGRGMMNDAHTGEMMDRDVAAAMIGIPLFLWVGSQLAQGNLTGSAPKDAGGQAAAQTAGKTEYSFKVGNRLFPLRVVPEGISTAIQIDIAIHQGLADAKEKGQGTMSGVFKAVTNTGYMLGTKPYLGGLNSLISSLSTKSAEDVENPTDAGNFINRNTLVKKVASSALVPSIVKDAGVIKDTVLGRPRMVADTAMEAVRRRAGFTKGMVPEVNAFGEEVTHPMMGKVTNDPARVLAEKFPPQPVDRTREGVKLSQQDYYELKKNVGQQRKQAYTTLTTIPEFMQAPKGLQQLIVEKLIAKADEIGSVPEKIKEILKDPLYYKRKARILLEIDKPGGERHFPFLK